MSSTLGVNIPTGPNSSVTTLGLVVFVSGNRFLVDSIGFLLRAPPVTSSVTLVSGTLRLNAVTFIAASPGSPNLGRSLKRSNASPGVPKVCTWSLPFSFSSGN